MIFYEYLYLNIISPYLYLCRLSVLDYPGAITTNDFNPRFTSSLFQKIIARWTKIAMVRNAAWTKSVFQKKIVRKIIVTRITIATAMTAALTEDVTQRKTVINVMSITIAMAMNAAWMESAIPSMTVILINVSPISIARLRTVAMNIGDAEQQILVNDQKIV